MCKGPDEKITNFQISYNELGQKVSRYNYGEYKVTATALNQPSEEAIKAANRVYNELFYKFNPQPRHYNNDLDGGRS
ncbi:hypothetical protein [Paenibacillus durus]|uniref:Uncharacterized protein n=1 Tax=Paenibacillus durus ATCC 35681 TaxID=1333534 RepID=A0A0F7CIH6_PAEDU|nr:hypothetical protein [Paenibacillus durus]AKG34650.1 hypothetical protein VK70_08720 [Paenibacillus durus ATCC 35681]